MEVEVTEFYTPALVLTRTIKNDSDAQLVIYTKELGKISALIKSVRKPVSKLSGHLVVGRLADVRIIDKGAFQVVDALSRYPRCQQEDIIQFLHFLDVMTPYNQPDGRLWHAVEHIVRACQFAPAVYGHLLVVMGFAPPLGGGKLVCQNCSRAERQVAYFYMPDIMFLCSQCLRDAGAQENEVVKIA